MVDAHEDFGAVAVVGLAGRFADARDADDYWTKLMAGHESIRTLSPEELSAAGERDETLRDERYVPRAAPLTGHDLFDAGFFSMSPREARSTDPQHRLMLETAWHALEDAVWDPARFDGRIGMFAGAGMNLYLWMHLDGGGVTGRVDGLSARLANDRDFLTTLVSYKLDLRGPSIGIQTACSTSLVAVHMACQSLLGEECDMALAGGVTVMLPQGVGYVHKPDGTMAADGRCRPFAERATGLVEGSGVGLVALRRLGDALRDGDRIRAVIRSSAVNNDGAAKVGYTAPSVEAQAAVIREAIELAGVAPETIGYVEAHGTGTRVGDPIEVQGLTRAFATDEREFCALGSVKANIGHCDTAAGVASLIKAVLAVEHGVVPPNPAFDVPNPLIDFDQTPFYVNREPVGWRTDGPRRAGVSSFGMGGTNAHVVLEEAPANAGERAVAPRPVEVLCLSAKDDDALARLSSALADRLEADPGLTVAAAADTLATMRRGMTHRRAVTCRTREEAVRLLRDGTAPGPVAAESPGVAYLFPGQGAQRAGMARELAAGEPVFRAALERCLASMPADVGRTVGRLLSDPSDPQALDPTELAQPALFTMSFALAALWRNWGVAPQTTFGHSIGEFVAATLAGTFTLEDAVTVVCERGRVMAACPPGAMLAAATDQEGLAPLLGEDVDLAAVNGPRQVVASGTLPAIERLAERLADAGIRSKRLHTSHAFHSRLMDPAVEPFRDVLESVRLSPPTTPFVSSAKGRRILSEEATSPAYWTAQLREPVQVSAALSDLAGAGLVLIEVGPGRTLTALARSHGAAAGPVVISSVSCDEPSAVRALAAAAGAAWESGVAVDWAAMRGGDRARVRLPRYPFARERHWVDELERRADVAPLAEPVEEAPPRPSSSPDTSEAELRVAAIFGECFGVPEVRRDDDFFALGGNSLIAVDVIEQLRRAFGPDVGLKELFDSPRVCDLAAALERGAVDDEDLLKELEALDPGELERMLGQLETEGKPGGTPHV